MFSLGLLLLGVISEQVGNHQRRQSKKESSSILLNGILVTPSTDVQIGLNGIEIKPPGLWKRLRSFLWETVKKTIHIAGVAMCLGLGIATVNHFSQSWKDIGLGAPPGGGTGGTATQSRIGGDKNGSIVASGSTADPQTIFSFDIYGD